LSGGAYRRAEMAVVAVCEFVVAAPDLAELRLATDRCARHAARVLAGRVERLLYDRVLALLEGEPDEAVAAVLELRRVLAGPADLAAGLADGATREWGRAHVLARALANAARAGEVLVDERLHARLGLACEPAGTPGIAAWRVLSGS
jgi:hypothetical protein